MPTERTIIVKNVSPGTFQRLWIMKRQMGQESWLGWAKELLEGHENLGEHAAKDF